MEISENEIEIRNENGKIVLSENGLPKASLDVDDSNYYCVGYFILYSN